MPYDYLLIDADTHYYETDDCFSRHIDEAHRDIAFRPLARGDGLRDWAVGDRVVRYCWNTSDRTGAPGSMAEIFAGKRAMSDESGDLGVEMIRPLDVPHMVERTARLQHLDRQGVQATIVLPSNALLVEADFRDRPDVICANFRSFNRWVEEEWGYGADGRIFGVPILTLVDLDWAVSELERVADNGAPFVFLKPGPVNGRSPADPVFDRFWARVEETGVRPIFHIGDEGFNVLYSEHWGEDSRRTAFEYSAFQHVVSFYERAIHDTMAALVLHNLFGRFPGVEVLTIELGSSWVRPLLTNMDKAARFGANGVWLGGRISDEPSDIFRQHVYVSPFHEDDIAGLAELIGVERVLFGSDYPHPEGLAAPADYLSYDNGLAGLDPADIKRIMRDNTASLLGLD